MNIVIANKRYFESTGPERYLFAIKKQLEKDGHLVAPFSINFKQNNDSIFEKYFVSPPADSDTLYFKDYKSKLTVLQKLRILGNSFYSIEAGKKMGKLIDDHNIELAYLLGISTFISPSVINAAKKRGIPVVMRMSDFFMFCAANIFSRGGTICRECETYGYKRALKYKCLKDSFGVTGAKVLAMYIHKLLRIYGKVDAFITPSACMRDAFLTAGYPEEKIHHIPSFLNSHAIEPCYDNRDYILYFGRVDVDKGIINLIKAYEIGNFKTPLLIAGETSDGEGKRLKRYVLEKKISNIDFVGFKKVQELIPLIQQAIFTVVPSLCLDNSPMSVLESMACGKPVIGSDIGGISEQITQECGLLVPPNDPAALASAIDSLLIDPQQAINMGKSGRRRVELEYSLENHYGRLMPIFRRLLDAVQ